MTRGHLVQQTLLRLDLRVELVVVLLCELHLLLRGLLVLECVLVLVLEVLCLVVRPVLELGHLLLLSVRLLLVLERGRRRADRLVERLVGLGEVLLQDWITVGGGRVRGGTEVNDTASSTSDEAGAGLTISCFAS